MDRPKRRYIPLGWKRRGAGAASPALAEPPARASVPAPAAAEPPRASRHRSVLDRNGSFQRVGQMGFSLLRSDSNVRAVPPYGRLKLYTLRHFRLLLFSRVAQPHPDDPLLELCEKMVSADGSLEYARLSHSFRQLVMHRRALLHRVGVFYATTSVALSLGFSLELPDVFLLRKRELLITYSVCLASVTFVAALHFASYLAQMTLLGTMMQAVKGHTAFYGPNRTGVSFMLVMLGAWTASFSGLVCALVLGAPLGAAVPFALALLGVILSTFERAHVRAIGVARSGMPASARRAEIPAESARELALAERRHHAGTLEDANLDANALATWAWLVVFAGYQNLVGPLWEMLPFGSVLPGGFMVVACLLALLAQARLVDAISKHSLLLDPLDAPYRPWELTDTFCLYALSAFSMCIGAYVLLISLVPMTSVRLAFVCALFAVLCVHENLRLERAHARLGRAHAGDEGAAAAAAAGVGAKGANGAAAAAVAGTPAPTPPKGANGAAAAPPTGAPKPPRPSSGGVCAGRGMAPPAKPGSKGAASGGAAAGEGSPPDGAGPPSTPAPRAASLSAENTSREFRMLVLRRRLALEFLGRFYIVIAIFFTRASNGRIPAELLRGYFTTLAVSGGVPSLIVALRFTRMNAGIVRNGAYWAHLTGGGEAAVSAAGRLNRLGVSYLLFVLVTAMASACVAFLCRLLLRSWPVAAACGLGTMGALAAYCELVHRRFYASAVGRIRAEAAAAPEPAESAERLAELRTAHMWGSLGDAHDDITAIVIFACTVIFTGSQIFSGLGHVEAFLSVRYGASEALTLVRYAPALWGAATLLVSLVSLVIHRRLRTSVARFGRALDPSNLRGDSPRAWVLSDLFLSRLLLVVMLLCAVNLVLFGTLSEGAMLGVDGALLVTFVALDRREERRLELEFRASAEHGGARPPLSMHRDWGSLVVEFSNLLGRRRHVLRFFASFSLAMGFLFINVLEGWLPSSMRAAQTHFFTTWSTLVSVVTLLLALRVIRIQSGLRVLAEPLQARLNAVGGVPVEALPAHLRGVHDSSAALSALVSTTACAATALWAGCVLLRARAPLGVVVGGGALSAAALGVGLALRYGHEGREARATWVQRADYNSGRIAEEKGRQHHHAAPLSPPPARPLSAAQLNGYLTMLVDDCLEDIGAIMLLAACFASAVLLAFVGLLDRERARDGRIALQYSWASVAIGALLICTMGTSMRMHRALTQQVARCTLLALDEPDAPRSARRMRGVRKMRFSYASLALLFSFGVFFAAPHVLGPAHAERSSPLSALLRGAIAILVYSALAIEHELRIKAQYDASRGKDTPRSGFPLSCLGACVFVTPLASGSAHGGHSRAASLV